MLDSPLTNKEEQSPGIDKMMTEYFKVLTEKQRTEDRERKKEKRKKERKTF
jgi:hypothetical protein